MLLAHFAAGAWLATWVLAADPASTLRSPDGAEMVLVPAGPFTLGSLDGAPEESPPQRVNWPAFYIDRQEVTVGKRNGDWVEIAAGLREGQSIYMPAD